MTKCLILFCFTTKLCPLDHNTLLGQWDYIMSTKKLRNVQYHVNPSTPPPPSPPLTIPSKIYLFKFMLRLFLSKSVLCFLDIQ